MEQLDLEYYSREIFALGKEAMEKLSEFKVLVTGMSPLGTQVARLLVVSGVKTVAVHDDSRVSADDIRENDLLKEARAEGEVTRAQALAPVLQQFNRRVTVNAVQGDLFSVNIKDYDLIVATALDLTTLTRLSNLCREKSKHIGLVVCEAWGAMGTVFVDFNNEFLVYDKDGMEPESYLITNISQSCPGIVTIEDDLPLKLKDGDWVTFKGVNGMVEVTLPEPRPIKCISSSSFSIEDTSAYSGYVSGGVVSQFKMPDLVSFKSFQDSLLFPTFDAGLSRPDVTKSDRVGQLHFAYHAVMEYRRKYQCLPCAKDVDTLFLISSKLNAEAKEEEDRFSVEAINKDLITAVSASAGTNFRPIISIISGIAALEVIKFTGKFMPIRQWFHYDCFDALPGLQPTLDRGRNWHTLVVGAGAVGCELLALLHSLEIGSGTGSISVVDDGAVSYPTLCTHSLFREEDVGRRKAEIVVEVLKRRKPDSNIRSLTCPIEDPQLSDEFWESKDLILCTVDSEASIKLTESKAIWYEKPSLFAFMSSTSTHLSSLLPQKTGSLEFFPEEEPKADSTLLSSFPCRASMCVDWSIQLFSHLFLELPSQALKYMENPQAWTAEVCNETLPSARFARFELLRDFFEVLVSTDPAASVVFARRRFEQLFTTNIGKLLAEHPLDQEVEEGKLFWSGRRLPPEPTAFDANEDLHFNYLETCADLISQTVGRTLGLNKLEVKKIANQTLRSRAEPHTNSAGFDELQASIDALCPQASKAAVHPLTYQKDDPSGTQLEFIVSASHIRCGNYKIEPMERLKIKQIAGGLQPSLPAMSSFVAGLAAAEVLKLAAGVETDHLKEIRANLAGPELALTELRSAPAVKPMHSLYEESAVLIPAKFTLWDKVHLQGPMTVAQLKERLERDFSVHILIIYSGSVVFYNVVNAGQEVQSDLYALYQAKTQTARTSKYLALKVEARTQADDRNAVLPVIKYAL